MRVWQKVILGFIFTLLLMVVGVVAYGTKVYYDLKATAGQTYQSVERLNASKREEMIDYSQLDPISVLLLGVDTDEGRKDDGDYGRTDSIIVATINPRNAQTTMVSIPRDTIVAMNDSIDYTPDNGDSDYEDGYNDEDQQEGTYTAFDQNGNPYQAVGTNYDDSKTYDKINAAYAYGGAPLAIDTIENLLDIPIDYYATVNMDGMADLIEAVGGVNIHNEIEFDLNGEHFELGDLHLNGKRAVEWARMRYEDPNGDYGRQGRQRIVLEKVADKITSVGTIANYQNLLEVVGENGKTDLDWDTIKTLLQNYTPALQNFVMDQMQGTDYTGDGYFGYEGISYQEIPEDELLRIQTLLKDQLQNNQ